MGCSSKIQVYLLDDWTIPPYSSYVLSLLTSDTLQKSWMLAMCSLFFRIMQSVNPFSPALIISSRLFPETGKWKLRRQWLKPCRLRGFEWWQWISRGGLNITMIFKRVGERDFRYRKPKPKINTLLSTQSIGFRVGCPFVGQWTKISINLDALYLYGP